jgi:hypothetical protein
MSNALDLKQIERKAFRSTYQDGLWDILLGVIVAAMAITIYRPESGYSPMNIIGMVLIYAVVYSLFWAAKKYITLPRMGQVRFGPTRQQKKKTLAIILGIIVLIQAFVVGVTVFGWLNPVFGAKLLGSFGDYSLEHLAVAALGSFFVGPSMLVIAYLIDFPRGYYIAILMALAVFLMILINQPIYPVVIGVLIIVPGLVLFIHFLKKYPLPQGDETNG